MNVTGRPDDPIERDKWDRTAADGTLLDRVDVPFDTGDGRSILFTGVLVRPGQRPEEAVPLRARFVYQREARGAFLDELVSQASTAPADFLSERLRYVLRPHEVPRNTDERHGLLACLHDAGLDSVPLHEGDEYGAQRATDARVTGADGINRTAVDAAVAEGDPIVAAELARVWADTIERAKRAGWDVRWWALDAGNGPLPSGSEVPALVRSGELTWDALGATPANIVHPGLSQRVEFAFGVPRALPYWRAEHSVRLGVRWVLHNDGTPEAAHAEAEHTLTLATEAAVRAARAAGELPEDLAPPIDYGPAFDTRRLKHPELAGGVLFPVEDGPAFDARTLALLRTLAGREKHDTAARDEALRYIDDLEAAARKDWDAWRNRAPAGAVPELPLRNAGRPSSPWDDPTRPIRWIAAVVWLSRVRPALRERREGEAARPCGAMWQPALQPLLRATRGVTVIEGDVLKLDGKPVARFDVGGAPLVSVNIVRALPAATSLHAQRALRFAADQIRLRRIAGSCGALTLEIQSGLEGLARYILTAILRRKPPPSAVKKLRDELRHVLDWGACVRLADPEDPAGYRGTGLWTWHEKDRPSPGSPGVLEWVLSPWLFPGDGRGTGYRVPLPLIEPPFTNERSAASLARTQFALMGHALDRKDELAARGYFTLDARDWRRIADNGGSSSKVLSRIRYEEAVSWLAGDDEAAMVPRGSNKAPAVLVVVGTNRYRPAPAYDGVRESIVQAAGHAEKARDDGRVSAAVRRGARPPSRRTRKKRSGPP